MSLFPTEKFEIKTEMTREEIVSRLRNVTEKRRFLKIRREKPFEGEVRDDGFKIRLVGITPTWSDVIGEMIRPMFLGISSSRIGMFVDIRGELRQKENGTVASVKMTPMLGLKAFLIMWVGMGILMTVICLAAFIDGNNVHLFIVFIQIAIILFGYGIAYAIFKRGTREIKPLLTAILQK